jgi:hypothetical protein
MQSLRYRFLQSPSCSVDASIDPVIECLEAHCPDTKLRLRHFSTKKEVKPLAEINFRLLSSPLLNTLDLMVKDELESSVLLREITKTPNKLQFLRLKTRERYFPQMNQLPIWELEDFEKLAEAFPGLLDLAIDIGLERGKWVRFGNPHPVERKIRAIANDSSAKTSRQC